MKQIPPLTDAEELTLTEAYKNHPVFRVRQRAHALLLNRRGYSMARLRELFEVQHETVSRWLHRWESEGITGLMDEARSGCPPKLEAGDVNILMKAIKQNPHQLTMARDQLQAQTGKKVSRDTLKRILKKTPHLQMLPPVLPTQTR